MKEIPGKCRFNVLISVFLVLVLLAVPVSAGAVWEAKEVPYENASVVSGEISGDYVIFLASKGFNLTDNRVVLYNTGTGEKSIIGTPSHGMSVTGEDVSGDYAVWVETPAPDFEEAETETKPNTIYLMNIPENSVNALSLPGTAEWPKISGETILWSNSSETSMDAELNIYDIKTGESKKVFSTNGDDSGIIYDGENILYDNMTSLRIHNVKSGLDTAIFDYEHGNESASGVDSFAMAGDYVVYVKRTVVFEGDDRGTYYEPYLYTISTGKSQLLNPETGAFADSLTKQEKESSINSPFTDGKTVGWGYLKKDYNSEIIMLYPETQKTSKIDVSGSVSNIRIDGNQMIWTVSHFPSFDETLYYSKESAKTEETPASPGFSAIVAFTGLTVSLFVIRKIRK